MYHVYVRQNSGFEAKKLVGEFADIDDAYDAIDAEVAKDKDVKYVLEETTGHVDVYGELTSRVVEQN